MGNNKPLPFHLLYADSHFKIHSEASRGILRSDDTRTYRKVAESHSVQVDEDTGKDKEPEVVCILRPNDLVVPVSRPRNKGVRTMNRYTTNRNTTNNHH